MPCTTPSTPCEKCGRPLHPRRRAKHLAFCPGAPPPAPALQWPPHCEWCADTYRAAVLLLPRQRVSLCATARYLGLPKTTVVGLVRRARERGCLPPPTCPYCPTPTAEGGPCGAEACRRRYNSDKAASNRARLRSGGAVGKRGGRRLSQVTEGVVLPRLPLPPAPHRRKEGDAPPFNPPPGAVLVVPPRTPPVGSLCLPEVHR